MIQRGVRKGYAVVAGEIVSKRGDKQSGLQAWVRSLADVSFASFAKPLRPLRQIFAAATRRKMARSTRFAHKGLSHGRVGLTERKNASASENNGQLGRRAQHARLGRALDPRRLVADDVSGKPVRRDLDAVDIGDF